MVFPHTGGGSQLVYGDIDVEVPEKILEAARQDKTGVLQYNLAQIYKDGTRTIRRDPAKYSEWLSASEAKDYELALYDRGMELRNSLDYGSQEEAIPLFARAAKKGHGNSQFELAKAYYEGDVLNQDLRSARFWYSQASDKGVVEASYSLGVMYQSGDGVPVDPSSAMKYFKRASDSNHTLAQYKLGIGYYTGVGIERDLNAAHAVLQKSMMSGNINAWRALRKFGIT